MRAEKIINFSPEHQKALYKIHPDSKFRQLAVFVMKQFLSLWNDLEIDVSELPQRGPALFYCNHVSLLDVPVLMVADPYCPQTVFPVKAEMYRIPLIAAVLKSWGVALAVDRDGHDQSSLKHMINLLEKEGRTVCLALEGTRSADGHLQPFDPAAVGLGVRMARKGVPIHVLAITGTYEALPKGAVIPGRHKITLTAGKRLDLSDSDREIAASRIRASFVELLPPQYHPSDNRLMWDKRN